MKGLDDMYSRIMEGAIQTNGASFNAYCSILQCILAAQRPLRVSEMQKLLKKGSVPLVVKRLASVLGGGRMFDWKLRCWPIAGGCWSLSLQLGQAGRNFAPYVPRIPNRPRSVRDIFYRH